MERNDARTLGAALALLPIVFVLQTLVYLAVPPDAAFANALVAKGFRVAFLAAGLAPVVALARVRGPTRTLARGTAVLAAAGVVSDLFSAFASFGTDRDVRAIAEMLSNASSSASFVLAIAVFVVVLGLGRGLVVPFRLAAILAFMVLTAVAVFGKLERFVEPESRTPAGAWISWSIELLRMGVPIALAFVTARVVRDEAAASDQESPYRSAGAVVNEVPPVVLDRAAIPAWQRAEGALGKLGVLFLVRACVGAFIGFQLLLVASGGPAGIAPVGLVVPLGSIVIAVLTLAALMYGKPVASVDGGRLPWVAAQVFTVFVILVDAGALMMGLTFAFDGYRHTLEQMLALDVFSTAWTLALNLAVLVMIARTLVRAGEAFRDDTVASRARIVLATSLCALGGVVSVFAATLSVVDGRSKPMVVVFVLMVLVTLAAVAASIGLLASALSATRRAIERARDVASKD